MEISHPPKEVEQKEDNSPLTLADQKCNQHICEFLKKNYRSLCGLTHFIETCCDSHI